ncbi:MAG: hypothetical protein WA125_06260 [Desulfosporosinus sp.]
MPNYYTEVTEDIIGGHLAYADDIKLIQSGIQAMASQLICDNFGEGYVLDDDENSFLISPVSTTIDQMNEPTTQVNWQPINDLYIRQTIDIEKSSVESIKVYVKNSSGANKVLHGELRTLETDTIDSELISSYEVTIPASQTTGGYCTFLFNSHHLAQDSYYLVIKYATGISIRIDIAGRYNKSFATSTNGVQYQELPQDIWFEESYAKEGTYNVVKGNAIIHGEKTQSLDTHVTISERSLYGNRIDIIVLNKEGQFEVVQGDVAAAGKPIPPDDLIPYGRLKIAYVTVPVNIPGITPDPILIDQEDVLGHSRMRSHHERIRRLEKKTDWIFNYNSPERIKYNLTGSTFYDASASQNVEPILAGTQTIGYQLASNTVNNYYWSFKDFAGNPPIEGEYESDNGIGSYTEIDHSDHSLGICKLQKRTSTEMIFSSNREASQRTGGHNRKVLIYKDNRSLSAYPGNSFTLTSPTKLTQINLDARFYRNAASVRMELFIPGAGIKAISDTKDLRGYGRGAYNIINTEVFGFQFYNIDLDPGQYYWRLVIDPLYNHTPAETWLNTINYPGRGGDFMVFQGQYPPPRVELGVKYRLAETMIFDIIAQKDVLAPVGIIQSSMIDTTDGIGSIATDMNLNLPVNTLYELHVTNDNGTTWQRMQGKYLNFPSTGHQFMWRLTLKSNDNSSTPVLSYNNAKQYAIKFSLGLSGGTPETKGSLVTIPLCGDSILQEAIPLSSTIDKFSHWEWLRMWCSENYGTINVDIEAVDELASPVENTIWTNIKSGLTLDELYHGSVDYSNYEGSYEEDEYNYHCDLDEEIILQDQVIIDRCEEAWVEIEDSATLTHTVDGSVYQEGTKSAKVALTNYTEGSVFMSTSIANLDLSRYDSIQFYIRTDKSGGLAANDIQFCIGTSAQSATGEFHNIPVIAANTWTRVTIPLTDPEALTQIVSLGLKRSVSGTAWNGCSIWIDNVMGIISNLRTIDECETAFTTAQSTNVTCSTNADHQSGTYSSQIAVNAGAATGLLAYKTLNEDLSDFNQIRFWFKSITTATETGDFELVFGSNTTCTSVIGDGYYIPNVEPDTWVRVVVDLESPGDYEAVRSIGIRMLTDRTLTFRLDEIEGLKTVKYPFYQKCVRFRFNLERDAGTDLSPVIRKVGVIPVVD